MSTENKYLDYIGLTEYTKAIDNRYSRKGHKHTKSEITDFPVSMPASDVHGWAKAEKKPSYTTSEVIAGGDKLYITAEEKQKIDGITVGEDGVVDLANRATTATKVAHSVEIESGSMSINFDGSANKNIALVSGSNATLSSQVDSTGKLTTTFSSPDVSVTSSGTGNFIKGIAKNGHGITVTKGSISAAEVPLLDAGKITTGTIGVARIPLLNANKINDGVFDIARIPALSVEKIPTLTTEKIPLLNANKINDGVFDIARIPNVNSKVTALDASVIASGTISIDHLPKAALETLVIVKDETAKNALTENEVQIGDVVKLSDTGAFYYVSGYIDGKSPKKPTYENYAAGSAASVPWTGVTSKPETATRWPKWDEITVGKPSTFTPSTHRHNWSEIDSKPETATRWPKWSEITEGKPSTFTPSTHSHPISQVTNLQTELNNRNNQNAFAKVTVGDATIAADTTQDTLTLVAGSNITITPDTSTDKITISSPNVGVTTSGTGSFVKSVATNGHGVTVTYGNPTTYSLSVTESQTGDSSQGTARSQVNVQLTGGSSQVIMQSITNAEIRALFS